MKKFRRSKVVKTTVTIDDILDKQPNAKELYRKLLMAGIDRGLLEQLLVGYASHSSARLPLVGSMKNRTLRRLVDHIVELSDEIARVNASPFVDPRERTFPLSSWRGKPLAPVFAELPDTLMLYAGHLSFCIARLPGSLRMGDRQVIKLALVALALHSTGGPHFEDIAGLLTAAHSTVGEQKDVSASALLQLVKHYPWASEIFKPIFERLLSLDRKHPT